MSIRTALYRAALLAALTLVPLELPELSAQEAPPAQENPEEARLIAPDQAIFGSHAPITTNPSLMQARWELVLDAIESEDLKAVNDGLYALDQLRLQGGFESLEEYSGVLLQQGYLRLAKGDIDGAGFYAKKSLQLSPESVAIKIQSLKLVEETGVASSGSQFKTILLACMGDLASRLALFRHGIYPILWALTLGTGAALYLFILYNMRDLLRSLAGKLPGALQAATPLVLLFFLVLPLVAGPLWCLTLWSLGVSLLISRARRFLIVAGAVVLLWCFFINQREKIQAWASMPGATALLNVATTEFDVSDRAEIEHLLKRRPVDGVAHYAYGVVLRRYGDFGGAAAAFEKAKSLLGDLPEIEIQKGLSLFLDGKAAEADKVFKDVQDRGYSSAEFNFNYSKIKFELTDTLSSRELFVKANASDPDMTEFLRQREDLLGLNSSAALAELRIPYRTLSRSIDLSADDANEQKRIVAQRLMPGFGVIGIGACGAVLLAVGLLSLNERKRSRLPPFYNEYRQPAVVEWLVKFFPGGAWLLAGKPVVGSILISIFALLAMPIIGWPYGGKVVHDLMIGVFPFYLCTVGLVALITTYVGSLLEEEG